VVCVLYSRYCNILMCDWFLKVFLNIVIVPTFCQSLSGDFHDLVNVFFLAEHQYSRHKQYIFFTSAQRVLDDITFIHQGFKLVE